MRGGAKTIAGYPRGNDMAYEFFLGVDPDDDTDAVTLALIEKARYRNEDVVTYHVRQLLQRDGTDERAVAQFIQNMVADEPYVGRTDIVVNRTERRGRHLVEYLQEAGLSPIGVTITGGDSAAQTGLVTGDGPRDAGEGGFLVSEHELVQNIEDLYGGGRFDMNQDSPEVSSLGDGLLDYMNKAPEAGVALQHIDREPHREGLYDSLVLGAALACWYGEQMSLDDPEEDLEEEIRSIAERVRTERIDTSTNPGRVPPSAR